MARVEGVLVMVVVVMMVGAVLAAIPGPRNPRYPDYIVYPRAMCVEEGSFSHPQNCSWYYRCVDRMNIGYYYTYYYECEPGTVFSDELDQCVFPFYLPPPCGTAGLVSPVTGTTGPSGSDGTTGTTSSSGTSGVTTPSTTTAISIVDGKEFPCDFTDETCKNYEICDPDPVIKSLCTGCYIGAFHIDIGLLCTGTNSVYDRNMKQCIPTPTDEHKCTDSSTVGIDLPTVDINYTKQITCSLDDLTPFAEWIKKDYCKGYVLCGPSKTYIDTRSLCKNYYLCKLEDNKWTTTREACPEGQVFDYNLEKKGCVDIPTNEC